MLENKGNSCKNQSSKSRRRCLFDILYRLLGGIVIIALYFGIIAPLLFTFLIPPLFVHSGVEYYTQTKYQAFEDSDAFQDFIDSLDFLDDGKAVSFYHVDHLLRDNPIYGKHFDVFALDVALESDDYALSKDNIVNSAEYSFFGEMGDYDLYELDSLPYVYVLAVCDSTQQIRCILITDLTDSPMLDTLFAYHTDLMWDCGE